MRTELTEKTKLILDRIVECESYQDLDHRVLASIFFEATHANPCAQHIIANFCDRCGHPEMAEDWFDLAAGQGYKPSSQRLAELRVKAA